MDERYNKESNKTFKTFHLFYYNINLKIRRTNYGKNTFNTIKYSYIYNINCISRTIFFGFSIRTSRRRFITRVVSLFTII